MRIGHRFFGLVCLWGAMAAPSQAAEVCPGGHCAATEPDFIELAYEPSLMSDAKGMPSYRIVIDADGTFIADFDSGYDELGRFHLKPPAGLYAALVKSLKHYGFMTLENDTSCQKETSEFPFYRLRAKLGDDYHTVIWTGACDISVPDASPGHKFGLKHIINEKLEKLFNALEQDFDVPAMVKSLADKRRKIK